MKKRITRILLSVSLFVCLLVLSMIGVSAASNAQSVTPGDLASAVTSYKQSNPSAAQHTITASHRVVYAKDAYFKDMVNATTSRFACYAKTGSDAIVTRLSQLGVSTQAVSDDNAASNFEILVGVVDRAAQQGFLPLVDVNEFGIMVTQNQIILMAWQDAALKVCVDTFLSYLSSNSLSLPVGFCGVGVANSAWKADFVRPTGTGIALSAGQFVNDDSLQFLYTGAGVTRDAYLTYCTQLVSDGFSLVWQNTVGSNEFRMYQNASRGTALYAAYNDYTYKAEFDALYQTNYGTYDDGFAPKFEKCIRLISSPLSSVAVPPASINAPSAYTKVTDSYMTTLGIASAQVGSGHVILLEDGRFVIIDGGYVSSKKNGVYPESKAIWDTMLALYKKAYGSSAVPTAQRPLHVAAWYLTHAHSDHYYAFLNMVEMIGADASKKAVFKMDYVIANLPGEYSMFDNTSTRWGYNNSSVIHSMKSKVGNFTFLKVHTGQRIYFANLMIEVLMTFEDHLPARIYNTNDTNTILRFHIGSSGAAVNTLVTGSVRNAVTVMFLGDSWRPSSRFLCAMYGDYLKSDISQVAHHGNIGCEQELYEVIAPTGVLFNNDKAGFLSYIWGRTSSTNPETKHAYAVDQYVVRGAAMNGKTLKSVRYVWAAVAGTYTTLRFTATGAQYDAAFDLLTGRTVAYVDLTKPQAQQTGFAKHVHTAISTWKNDASYHWRECACTDVIQKAAHADNDTNGKCDTCSRTLGCVHDWGNGEITVPTSHLAPGVKRFTCSKCSGTKTEDIPRLTAHEYGAWEKHSNAYHKHTCVCGEVEYAAHTWNGGEVTEPATHLKAGTKTYTCTACAHTKESSISKLTAHGYGAWTNHDGTQHKRVCACGEAEYAAHAWDEGEITQAPTHLAFGERTFRCTVCGAVGQELLPKTADHSFGEWVTVKEATTDTEGERRRTCGCGESETERITVLQIGENTPNSGADSDVSVEREGVPPGTVILIAGGCAVLFGGGGFWLFFLIFRRKKRS